MDVLKGPLKARRIDGPRFNKSKQTRIKKKKKEKEGGKVDEWMKKDRERMKKNTKNEKKFLD